MALWKILRGLVVDKNLKLVRPSSQIAEGGRVDGFFYPGDVVRTDKDLSVHNPKGGLLKYEKLPDEPSDEDPVDDKDSELGSMKLAELRNRAEELELNQTSLGTKADYIEAIQTAMA